MSPRRIGRGFLGLFLCGKALAAPPDPQVEGRVLLDTGRPAAGAQVRLFDLADLSRSHGVTADEWGRFSLPLPGAAPTGSLPRRTTLLQNYPNPFNPSTVIPYQLSTPAHVRLEVFNVLGQVVATLVDQEVSAGSHTAIWHGTDGAGRAVAAGLYFYRLGASGVSETRRMVLVDGQAGAPGPASAIADPVAPPASDPVYVLTVSGPGVVTSVDPDFRAGPAPVEIVVEGRAGRGSREKRTGGDGDRILGDVDANGRVDIVDAVLVWLYIFDPTVTIPDNSDISLGDVNRDGRIDLTDFYYIATYSRDPAEPSLPEGIGDPVAVVVLEGQMYWVDRWTSKIQRANLDGSEVTDLVTTGLEEPTDLALDLEGGRMYWSDRLTGKIQRANLDGSRIEDLVTDTYGIWSLALDVEGERMYWTQGSHTGRKIQRANLDGSGVEDLITTGLFEIAGLSLDLAGGKMYWTDYGTKRIQRANLDGTRVEALITSGLLGPSGTAMDLTRGRMYWADRLQDTIQRANLDGSQVEVLLQRQSITGSLVVIPEQKMYWAEGGWNDVNDGGIHRANLDGSQVEEEIVGGLSAPRGLVLDLYGLPEVDVNRPPVLEGIPKQSLAEGEVLRVDLFGRDPEGTDVAYDALSGDTGVAMVSVTGSQLTIHPVAPGDAAVTVMASDGDGNTTRGTFSVRVTVPVPESQGRMYWTDWATHKIQRANLDGSQVEDLVASGLDLPSGLALDAAGDKLYWVDAGTDKIQRANLDGSGVEDLVTTGLYIPRNLALDVPGGKMYWTDEDWTEGGVRRANLDGSQVEDVLTAFGSPVGLALDLAAGKMYLSDTGGSRIRRASLDGSRMVILVTGLRLNSPRALALDLAGGKVYWQDSGTRRTQRANLDGSQAEDVHSSGLGYPTIGLALDPAGGKIYWTDFGRKEILRSNLDGTRIEVLVTGLGEPAGLGLEIFAADLLATDPWASPPDPAPGRTFSLSLAIRNQGQLPAPATTVRYYLSTDPVITGDDTEVGTHQVRALPTPGTTFKLIRLRAPQSPGDYYYGACVDPPAGEAETFNNCSPAVRVRVGG